MNAPHATALDVVREQFVLDPDGLHGVAHWLRVMEFGQRLAAVEGADLQIVQLFSLFHDARRTRDGDDPGHGLRAAEFAGRCRGVCFDLDDDAYGTLWTALAGHELGGVSHRDPTVRVCWDAERLDLPRFGVDPHPDLMFTETARDPEFMAWATDRSRSGRWRDVLPETWSRTAAIAEA